LKGLSSPATATPDVLRYDHTPTGRCLAKSIEQYYIMTGATSKAMGAGLLGELLAHFWEMQPWI
jgi:hypothetical protein